LERPVAGSTPVITTPVRQPIISENTASFVLNAKNKVRKIGIREIF